MSAVGAEVIRHATDEAKSYGLQVVSIGELLAMTFPPRDNILSPWLPSQGLALIYAMRGVGKTHLSLGIAYAVASGGEFLGWQAPEPRGVLFLDGEMPGTALQQRVANIAASAPLEPQASLKVITPDLQEYGMPDLSTEEGQAEVEQHITDDIDLIVIDNLSTLVRSGKENESESWQPIQTWALNLRSRGKSVLFIHHAGKGGKQRGTSRREDVLDTVIALRHPKDYSPEEGAVFEVHFEKARGIHGEDVTPIEARLLTDADGRITWATRSLEESTFDKVMDLLNEGLSQAEVARELEIHRSSVSRHAGRAKEKGLLKCT
jgi:hypothetical protein